MDVNFISLNKNEKSGYYSKRVTIDSIVRIHGHLLIYDYKYKVFDTENTKEQAKN